MLTAPMHNVVRSWFEEYPELLEREKSDMALLGFRLDERALESEGLVRFIGRSRYDSKRVLVVDYPYGYPSFAPRVFSPIGDVPPLARHHAPDSGQLCCFGFGDSEWDAGRRGLDAVLAAEKLIRDYSPDCPVPDDDVVPEPRIVHYSYTDRSAVLVPPPFATMDLAQLQGYRSGEIRLRHELGRTGHEPVHTRAVVTRLRTAGHELEADPYFVKWEPWLVSRLGRTVSLRVLSEPPPLLKDHGLIRDWLRSVEVSPPLKTDAWTLFVFPDEWGDRFTRRATWLALHTGDGLAEWVRCYSVTPDDVATRTPFGMSLSGKSVLLVGCGSLGSAAAVALAQEGVGNLVLIDGDRFEPGNSVRHQVAVHKFGIPKAVALEERVREVAPHCKVRSVEADVGLGRSRESREAFSEAFTNADIVVDTTGDQSVGHYLNYLCVTRRKPLVVGWVTNGIWSAEVLRYRPGVSGCRMCWSFGFGDRRPPEQPRARLQFAPGCNQPTFVGGAADVAVAGGLVARMTTETLLDPGAAGYDYLVWVNRTDGGQWQPRVELHAVPRHPQCLYCNAKAGSGDCRGRPVDT